MRRLKEIEILEEEVQSRILDHRYADSWEQATQISANIKRKEAELARLRRKVSKWIHYFVTTLLMKRLLKKIW